MSASLFADPYLSVASNQGHTRIDAALQKCKGRGDANVTRDAGRYLLGAHNAKNIEKCIKRIGSFMYSPLAVFMKVWCMFFFSFFMYANVSSTLFRVVLIRRHILCGVFCPS